MNKRKFFLVGLFGLVITKLTKAQDVTSKLFDDSITQKAADMKSTYVASEEVDRNALVIKCVADIMNGVKEFDQPHHKAVKFMAAVDDEAQKAIAEKRNPVFPKLEK